MSRTDRGIASSWLVLTAVARICSNYSCRRWTPLHHLWSIPSIIAVPTEAQNKRNQCLCIAAPANRSRQNPGAPMLKAACCLCCLHSHLCKETEARVEPSHLDVLHCPRSPNTPQLPFETAQIPSNRDPLALNRGALAGPGLTLSSLAAMHVDPAARP